MTDTVTLTVPSHPKYLYVIRSAVYPIVIDAGFPRKDAHKIVLAIDEACSNIIEHAYGGEERGDIECTCDETKDKLTIILCDQGEPFNPDEVAEPDLSLPLEDRDNHGLGLYFMRKWMDEIRFEHPTNGGNSVIMIKRKARII